MSKADNVIDLAVGRLLQWRRTRAQRMGHAFCGADVYAAVTNSVKPLFPVEAKPKARIFDRMLISVVRAYVHRIRRPRRLLSLTEALTRAVTAELARKDAELLAFERREQAARSRES